MSLAGSLYFVYFKSHAFLWGSCTRDNIIFSQCDFRSLGHQPVCIHHFEKQNKGAECVFAVDFLVDFPDLMMTSSQLPPTQRHTQNLCWCIFYYLLEIQQCTRLTEQQKVAGFPFYFKPCANSNIQEYLLPQSGDMQLFHIRIAISKCGMGSVHASCGSCLICQMLHDM